MSEPGVGWRCGLPSRCRSRLRDGASGLRPGCCVQAGSITDQLRCERVGTDQAARDARQDQCDVAGAEQAGGDGELGGRAALAQCGGEFAAVVDQLADEAEQAPGAAGLGGGGWCGGRGGHERYKNAAAWPVSRNIFIDAGFGGDCNVRSCHRRRSRRCPPPWRQGACYRRRQRDAVAPVDPARARCSQRRQKRVRLDLNSTR